MSMDAHSIEQVGCHLCLLCVGYLANFACIVDALAQHKPQCVAVGKTHDIHLDELERGDGCRMEGYLEVQALAQLHGQRKLS